MRGIKKDDSTFPKFKHETKQNEWYNKTKAQTRFQFVDEIFDTNYTPESIDDIKLFDIRKRCMYAVFINTLFIDTGKVLIRQHERD